MTPEELEKTYVFHDTEVRLTGRTAEREPTRPASTRPSTRKPPVVSTTLYEITPVDSLNGSWKKWVRMQELFEIK